MNVGAVDLHAAVGETGSVVDGDGVEFGVGVPVFVEDEEEFLDIAKGGDGHEAAAVAADDVRYECWQIAS